MKSTESVNLGFLVGGLIAIFANMIAEDDLGFVGIALLCTAGLMFVIRNKET
jgi:uncharacterized membrane protein